MRRVIFTFFLIVSSILLAQTLSIEKISDNVISQFDKIED